MTSELATPASGGPVVENNAVDVHAHVWNDTCLDAFGNLGLAIAGTLRGWDVSIAQRIAQLDEAGVAIQVISVGPTLPYSDDGAAAAEVAELVNDEYALIVREGEGRLVALGTLPLPDARLAIRELRRVLDELGFAGVTLTTTLGDRALNDPIFAPVFEELNARKSVVLLHPSGDSGKWPALDAFGFALPSLIGLPFEDTIAAATLALSGMVLRYPGIQFVCPHLGGMLPMVLARADNLGTVTKGLGLEEPPSVSLRRLWYDTVSHAHLPALRAAGDSLGPSRLLFGSDYPVESGGVYTRSLQQVEELGWTEAEAAGIRGLTARQLLRL